MSDIVERLRGVAHTYDEYGVHSEIELEAAKEIEKLRSALEEVRPLVIGASHSEARYPKARAALEGGKKDD